MDNTVHNRSENHGRGVQFTKTFITSKKGAGRIHPFFHKYGYKLEKEVDGQYWFKRGSPFAFLYAHDVKKYPTKVKIELSVNNGTVQTIIDYHVNTTGAIALKNDKETIIAEMNELEDYMKMN